ncbi:GNAT family N-acetyltransferase [uncultured Paraglaciecola sp.]|uniref:GNAT family N-acetyltransferase n=1 Tax=uncultured Paraglaciecola sp. TaxID=1765024 RepID=UPI0025DD3D15|nr:GNAT family N-acetyltransferase [uncultured Paraglaciecola sp.]
MSILSSKYTFKFSTSIEKIGQTVWDDLANGNSPFCQYPFLHALETSGSVGADSGWLPFHCVIYQNFEPVGILPLYKKTHSYGEYVFDFAWANTYKQHGINYYPKLVGAIPFTPVTGARLMLSDEVDKQQLLPALCKEITEQLTLSGMSSMHWLFVEQDISQLLHQHGQVQRHTVQFQWFNRQYSSFEDYLSHFNSRKRKNVKKERLKVTSDDVKVVRLHGDNLSKDNMHFFYHCYKQTYLKRSGHDGYLTETFFQQLFKDLRHNLMLVIALKDERPIASALFIFDHNQLCGRYWGALEEVQNLHFECCYYQGIEFCIEQNIAKFNPGTQGEHKILRGFEPIYCYSNHSLKELAFHEAVERFIQQENIQIAEYKNNAEKLLPFKQSEA